MNFFQDILNPLVTLVVGAIAAVIYFAQKRDRFRESAVIINTEISKMVSGIDQLKISLNSASLKGATLLAEDVCSIEIISFTNTGWNTFKHLFVKKLNQDEFACIDNFYANCSLLQLAIDRYKNELYGSFSYKAGCTQEKLSELALMTVLENKNEMSSDKGLSEISLKKYSDEMKAFVQLFGRENYLHRTELILNQIRIYFENVDKMKNSVILSKIRKLSSF